MVASSLAECQLGDPVRILDHAQGLASPPAIFTGCQGYWAQEGAVTISSVQRTSWFLIVIGAMQARDSTGVKICDETRNDLNQANNAETANIARTVSASMKTINNIQ